MSVEENKVLVRRYFEDAPYHPDVCDEIFAPSFHFHTIQHATITPQVVESTPQSEKAAYEWLQTVWSPDWRMMIDEMIGEGDRVMVRWTFHGMQIGEFSGLPPTNKQVIYSGINIFRVVDGKIAEIWDIFDRLWMWQQLGVLPEIKDAIAEAREAMESKQGGVMIETQRKVVLIFIDGTICDRSLQLPLMETPEFYEREAILAGLPVPGSVLCVQELAREYEIVYIGARPASALLYTQEWLESTGFSQGPVYLATTQEERLVIVKDLRDKFDFVAGIGDRWDDNELHLEIGCLSIIVKEHAGNWDIVRKYLLGKGRS